MQESERETESSQRGLFSRMSSRRTIVSAAIAALSSAAVSKTAASPLPIGLEKNLRAFEDEAVHLDPPRQQWEQLEAHIQTA